jgi:hypothetical protein
MAALTHVRHRIVSICSLVPLVGGAPAARSEAESETVNRLRAQLGGARVVQVRCLLAMHDDTAPEEVLARDGWHNLLVAQEDARGPEEAHELLPRSAGPVGLARHAAPVLAGVLGLWTGMTAGCLDDLPVPPQRQIRLVRGFYRRVDASAAETTLRHRVLATGTMPLPRQHGSVAVHVPDAAEACYKMANALCNKHPEVFPRQRKPVQDVPPEKVGLGKMLRWFFGFVWAALRNAPEDWFLAMKGRMSQVAAKAGQRGLLGGSESAYRVIVNGRGADGPAGWYDLREASSEAVEGLGGRSLHGAADLSDLWQDFAAGALTLLDGGARALPPIQVGNRGDVGVLRSAAQCVPDGEGDFQVTSPQVQARMDTERVQASDVIGSGLIRMRLAGLAADPRIRDANAVLTAFDERQRRNAATYSVQFARVLHEGIARTVDDIGVAVRELERLAMMSTDEEELARQRRSGRRTVIITVLAVLALVGIWAFRWAERTTTVAALAATALVLAVWLIAALLNFAANQRALFQALTRQHALPSQRATIEDNLREAVEDLQRLCEAYGQFLVWSRVVGAVVQTPFATAPRVDDGAVVIHRGLPLNTALGHARVADAQLEEVATELRRGLFVSGWLSGSWDAAVARPAAQLGARGPELGDADSAIFAQPSGPGSLLEQWAAAVVRDRRYALASGDRAWTGCTTKVGAAGAADVDGTDGPRGMDALAERLLLQVEPDDGTAGRTESRERFMARVDAPRRDPAEAKRFDSAHLAVGAARTATVVELNPPSAPPDGLSRTAVLVELGHPAPASDFGVCAVEEPPPIHPDRERWI